MARLALDRHVARKPRHVGLPGQDRERLRIRHRDHVRVVRALADVARGEPGEARALAQQVIDVVRRHQLGARLAVHVDKLGEEKLDFALADDPPDVVLVADLGRAVLAMLSGDSHV